MTTVFVLTAFTLDNDPVGDPQRRYTGLPIRIGRNALNDFVVHHPAISSFHARVEDIDGRLCVVDLGSKNGIHVPVPGATPRRVPASEPSDLSQSSFQFFLGAHIRIQIEFDQVRDALEFRSGVGVTGDVLGNRGMLLESQPPQPPPQAPMPSQFPPNGPAQMSPPAHANWGSAGSYQSPFHGPAQPPVHAPSHPSSATRQRPGASTQFLDNLGIEMLALQGLRELAASLVPGTPLDSTGDVARFITKLHDALDVFCRSFIPLRDGYSQFVSSLDLQRGSLRRSQQRSQAYRAIEAAHTPEAVAVALLNPEDRSFDAPKAVEGIFADLMLHQLALLEGVMRGVRALLEELSPENIERNAGARLPLGKYKALWHTYCQSFEDLYEERQTFAVIFGPEFTAAYRQYRAGKQDGEPSG